MEYAKLLPAPLVFKAFKYTVYTLLTLNIFLFYQEESLATAQTFSQGISLQNIIQGFAATIDTAAWVLLLLVFELETSLLDDRVLRRPGCRPPFWLFAPFPMALFSTPVTAT